MKAIVAIHRDGSRFLLLIVRESFDTQTWANQRARMLALLGVVKIVEETR